MKLETLGVSCVLLVAGCASPGWDGRIERWGTMREVMREGQTAGRVAVRSALTPDAVGLGALAGLSGEIVVLDGVAWIGRADTERARVEPAASGDQAALLVLARVPAWRTVRVETDIVLDAFDPRELGALNALTIPFVAQGDFADVEMHVLRGRCPYAQDETRGDPPLRASLSNARGTLVGFWTREPPGVLTHHDSNVHVHIVMPGPEGLVAHVDAVRVLAGSRVLVPD